MRTWLPLCFLALCLTGMVLVVVGLLQDMPALQEVGAWMTAPLWLLLGAVSVIAALGVACASLLRLAEAVRGRRRR